MATSAEDTGADPLIGHVLADRYRIDAQLGEGGMGMVYRAHHLGLDCPVAVKTLHAELTADPVVARRFDREAVALSKLDHPNCLRVLDAGTSPAGAKYIVMPLLAGAELRAHLDAPMPVPRAVDLTVQILRGLEHAHRRGLIHRDLKPENVFVGHDDDGREVAKLVDFGIVKMLQETGPGEPLTRAGLVFGTPRYMSPEQVTGGKIDERTDLYAVGVLLYEMLAGAPPFDAEDVGMLMRMQILADVPALPDTVPPAITEIVAKLLEKSPGDRPTSAKEVRESLERALLTVPGRTVIAASHTDPRGATVAAKTAVAPPPATEPAAPPPPVNVAMEATLFAASHAPSKVVAAPPPPTALGTDPTVAAAPPPPMLPAFTTDPTMAASAVPMPMAGALPTQSTDRRRWPIVAAIASALACTLLIVLLWPTTPSSPPLAPPPAAAVAAPLQVGTPPSAPTSTPATSEGGTKSAATKPTATKTSTRSRTEPARDDDGGHGKGHGKAHKKKKGKMKFEGGGFSLDID